MNSSIAAMMRFLSSCFDANLFNDLELAVDAQNFRHLGFELGVAAFQVVAHLVRLDLLLIEDLAQSALNQLAKAGVPFGRSMLTRVTSQKPGRPQFVRLAQVLRLAAGQRDRPCPGLGNDRRLLARPGTIVERRHWTKGQRPLNAALGRLMMQPQSLTHRKERRVLPVSQQHSRSTRLAGSVRERAIETSLAKSSSPIDNSIARRRAVMTFESHLANQNSSLQASKDQMNPSQKMVSWNR